jgi:hypothetical protein
MVILLTGRSVSGTVTRILPRSGSPKTKHSQKQGMGGIKRQHGVVRKATCKPESVDTLKGTGYKSCMMVDKK